MSKGLKRKYAVALQQATVLHEKSLEAFDEAFLLGRLINRDYQPNENDKIAKLEIKAFRLECKAAKKLLRFREAEVEPSRSILFRSAATLAFRLNLFRDAEVLCAHGIATKFAPISILNELRELMDSVRFHMEMEKIDQFIQPGTLNIHLRGSVVGHKIIKVSESTKRIEATRKIMTRNIERNRGQEFRVEGSPESSISREMETYSVVPENGDSFISLMFGSISPQGTLFPTGMAWVPQAASDLIKGINSISSGNWELFENLIPQKAYRENFLGWARKLGPDGTNITNVGVSSKLLGIVEKATLKQPIGYFSKKRKSKAKHRFVDGVFTQARAAERDKGLDSFGIKDINTKSVENIYYSDSMKDLFSSHWKERVSVLVKKHKKHLVFVDIYKLEDMTEDRKAEILQALKNNSRLF